MWNNLRFLATERSHLQAPTVEREAQGLDLAAIRRAAALLQGTHDFASFQSQGGRINTVRTLLSCQVYRFAGGVSVDANHKSQNLPRCVLEPLVSTRYEEGRWSGAKSLAKLKASGVEEAEGDTAWLSAETLPDRLIIVLEGAGFLYNMCRILAGTLLETGTGTRTEASVM
jgi:tRNA U38,U39,U40 pseudouridine synthase TruA